MHRFCRVGLRTTRLTRAENPKPELPEPRKSRKNPSLHSLISPSESHPDPRMAHSKPATVRLSSEDNVVVALRQIPVGTRIEGDVVCRSPIPEGHKVAIREIAHHEPIRKYGHIIGSASQRIQPGEHVHTHNVKMGDFARHYDFGVEAQPIEYVPESRRATFDGIVRADDQVATRNYIGVLATVNCSASVAHFIADQFSRDTLANYPNIDGVVALSHGMGCETVPEGEGFLYLQRALAGYAKHPNFAGILLIGLGCEVNQIDCLMKNMHLEASPSLVALNIQDGGGTKETVRRGVEAIYSMLPQANQIERKPLSASHIVLGLECGGSDAYSGISANPALGKAVDLLVRHGGTAILSETPETYGAEHLLTRRAITPGVGQKLVDRIRWWEDYAARLGAKMNDNPTPGNKAGGLTTILEKSLGAIAKGGSTNLVDVYGYAEPVTAKGLVFMDTPGYDPVSVTGMIAGGANIICFSTGRGSVCGFKPAPTLKLASNTAMYERMREDMDINCGAIIDGDGNMDEMGERIFHLILDTASGRRTKSEILGYGDNEFAPWPIGAVM